MISISHPMKYFACMLFHPCHIQNHSKSDVHKQVNNPEIRKKLDDQYYMHERIEKHTSMVKSVCLVEVSMIMEHWNQESRIKKQTFCREGVGIGPRKAWTWIQVK